MTEKRAPRPKTLAAAAVFSGFQSRLRLAVAAFTGPKVTARIIGPGPRDPGRERTPAQRICWQLHAASSQLKNQSQLQPSQRRTRRMQPTPGLTKSWMGNAMRSIPTVKDIRTTPIFDVKLMMEQSNIKHARTHSAWSSTSLPLGTLRACHPLSQLLPPLVPLLDPRQPEKEAGKTPRARIGHLLETRPADVHGPA